ncbi:hypothetical protein HPB52_001833 [Rhipicephalus sanguineus]|uniref:Uncharacterized protein n=1 Tax=Rhipicephalus sanguineus TaxID=34632 RepID=A0A9D4SMR0_RHISA|nr:hypothetical protein HPB52_001833 [Rhipicephalus sanguineus]
MICPQRPTPSIAKLRPGWTLVRRKLAMTNPAGPRSTKVRLGPNVIGVHLTDTVTPSKGAHRNNNSRQTHQENRQEHTRETTHKKYI